MQVNYKYPSFSKCLSKGNDKVLGLSPDLSRDEKVSFHGKLKNPLIFRDAMLMLREIVISDMSIKKKERVEFFAWLDSEIDRKVLEHEKFMPGVREEIQNNINDLNSKNEIKDKEIQELYKIRSKLTKEIENMDVWKDYYKLEREFWKFIKDRDMALWWVLDPVITVHPDQVSFEAFSLDESTYGCLSVDMKEFDLLQEPKLGTTNIDFSAKLAKEMERFRTYTEVELSVNPGGFTVESGVMPEYVEKKIDLPESWIKGFNQVSSAASLGGEDIEMTPTDMYDICSFMRRNKAKKSPRYMKWIMIPNENIKIYFEPFGKELILNKVYKGKRKKEEKIWGRRRWLVLEKIIPLTKKFTLRFLGFGMPQFIIADLGSMKMTIGFTSWSSNDWVKGTAFNILAGYIGNKNYSEVYEILKKDRFVTLEDLGNKLSSFPKKDIKSGLGSLLRRGEGYFDPIKDIFRFRLLLNEPINSELYMATDLELSVMENLKEGKDKLKVLVNKDKEFIIKQSFNIPNPNYKKWKYKNTPDYDRKFNLSNSEVILNEDGQITKVKCKCKSFNKGPRNISAPCSHILALYVNASKLLHLDLEVEKEYNMNDILEMLL
jgi:hypothetical protein